MSALRYDLMRHALGVHEYTYARGRRWSAPFRNHFVAGDCDRPSFDELVDAGYAERVSLPTELSGGMPTYRITEAGRFAALAGIEFKRRWGYGSPVNK